MFEQMSDFRHLLFYGIIESVEKLTRNFAESIIT